MKHLIKLYAVGIELTLACPCRCETCGSNGGKRRDNELSFHDWISVLDTLQNLGCQRVSLLGGEPLLHPSWASIAIAAKERGMSVEMITSGIGIGPEVAKRVYDTGMVSVTVSVDGTECIHNEQRRVNDGYKEALRAIRYLDEAGLRVGVNTQINRKTLPTLNALAPELQEAGAMGWQLQLTMPRGRATGCTDLAISPKEMPKVLETVRTLVQRQGLRPFLTDNIGYWTPDDTKLRTPPGISPRCWLGCLAGIRTLGIMSDGSVKGCLALPDTAIEGNIRDKPLEKIWNDPHLFAYNRSFDMKDVKGECATCKFGKICRGGCTAFALATHGKAHISTHCFRLHS